MASKPLNDGAERQRGHADRDPQTDPMGLKIQNSGLPPLKVLLSTKLHIIQPAVEYVQQISKPKQVRLLTRLLLETLSCCETIEAEQLQTFSRSFKTCLKLQFVPQSVDASGLIILEHNKGTTEGMFMKLLMYSFAWFYFGFKPV